MRLKKMNKTNKNSTIAGKQNSGINNKYLLMILACIKEYFKYIFFTVMVSIFAIWIGETAGKFIAYLIWN